MSKKYLLTDTNSAIAQAGSSTDVATFITINNTESSIDCTPIDFQAYYDAIYPVGYIHIGFAAPNVPSDISATWSKLDSYNSSSVWFDSSTSRGESVTGQLPDYSASFDFLKFGTTTTSGTVYPVVTSATGAFKLSNSTNTKTYGIKPNISTSVHLDKTTFTASSSNSIYSASAGTNVVRPTSVVVNCWQRTA